MPKRVDISSILILGAGPIVIGQACEFDYSGTQACKALKEEGYRVILVNSNPATIMTDPEFADRTYIEPLTVGSVARIIAKELPDAILPTVGGQTALNLALGLADAGTLDKYGVELIGAHVDAIRKAEDRALFKAAMQKLGLDVPRSGLVQTPDEAVQVLELVGLPAIIRPAFTLGGHGGNIATTREEYEQCVAWGLAQSPVHQVLIEASILGWKEFELEVMRDRADNVVIICSIENLDPMGVHTGDSITVAPAQTLTDKEYQRMRDAAKAIIREIGVDTGGANIQFAVNPADGALQVIEMNPRVSRSSALASKATGYPIAKIAAKLAVGYTLDELPNDITRETRASFEPTIDYVVTKIPRFAFEKFPHTAPRLTTQMKSVGEVMAIGRTFPESLQKAIRSLENGRSGLSFPSPLVGEGRETANGVQRTPANVSRSLSGAEGDVQSLLGGGKISIEEGIRLPTPDRLWWVAEGLRRGLGIDRIFALCKIDPWFLHQIARIIDCENALMHHGECGEAISRERLAAAKRLGFADAEIARLAHMSPEAVRALRHMHGIVPTFRMVDTCAAEFEAVTPYLYSSYGVLRTSCVATAESEGRDVHNTQDAGRTTHDAPCDEALPSTHRKIIILGSGPNRIGQGIEFDYCCVQAVFALRESGCEAIMVNCNPETVSTDYDTADRLYFEPLTFEDVMEIIARERPEGVMIQFGGQTPLKLAKALAAAGVRILGTSPEAIDCAEDRGLFRDLIETLGLRQPPSGIARNTVEARTIAASIGYPVMVRPSYVLGGRAMEVVYDQTGLDRYLRSAVQASPDHPVLIDRFLAGAIEVDVDALADGTDVVVVGIMEHVEEAGIHSGDSSCCLPPHSLSPEVVAEITQQTIALARALDVIGLMNVQFAVQCDRQLPSPIHHSPFTVYVLEVNPRASRTVPFVAKATGLPVARIATKLMIGHCLSGFQLTHLRTYAPTHKVFAVKTPVFPFTKFPGVDTLLGPEMKSTGEVMGIADTFGAAFAKAQTAAGNRLPAKGSVFLSVRDEDKPAAVSVARALIELGFTVAATAGTARYLQEAQISVEPVRKVAEGSPHVVDALKEGTFALVINTTAPISAVIADSFSIRRTTIECQVPYFTTIAAAQAAVAALQVRRKGTLRVTPIQEWHATAFPAQATGTTTNPSLTAAPRRRSSRQTKPVSVA